MIKIYAYTLHALEIKYHQWHPHTFLALPTFPSNKVQSSALMFHKVHLISFLISFTNTIKKSIVQRNKEREATTWLSWRKMRKVLHSRLIKRFCFFVCKHCHVHKMTFTAQTQWKKNLRMIHKKYFPSAQFSFSFSLGAASSKKKRHSILKNIFFIFLFCCCLLSDGSNKSREKSKIHLVHVSLRDCLVVFGLKRA